MTPPGSLRERDDESLMLLAAADQRGAFAVLVERYLPRVRQFCAKLVGDVRAGEELAQEALLDAWSSRRRYRSNGRFAVFLFTLARNRCRNYLRDLRRRSRWSFLGFERAGSSAEAEAAPDEEVADTATPDQLDLLLERERQRRVDAALESLPPKLREAVLLRFDQGLDYAAIAAVVGRPEATVRSRVFHAIRKLREHLEGGAP